MTVSELIEFLKTQPQDIQVGIQMYSEYCLLETHQISVMELTELRNDGWIHDLRPDKAKQQYLIFPGN
jgi:hypothetical protein